MRLDGLRDHRLPFVELRGARRGPAERQPVAATTAATVTAAAASNAAGGSFARSRRRTAAVKPASAGRIVRIGCIAGLMVIA
ncbi:hypothetical protein PL79_013640 [Burkholderia sp. USMB20]|nr:hypothetical protein PL79_013640 [Burkholderia sp. USMB20]